MKTIAIFAAILFFSCSQSTNDNSGSSTDSVIIDASIPLDSTRSVRLDITDIKHIPDTAWKVYWGFNYNTVVIARKRPADSLTLQPGCYIVHSDCLNKFAVLIEWTNVKDTSGRHFVELLGQLHGPGSLVHLASFGYEKRYSTPDSCAELIKDYLQQHEQKYWTARKESKDCYDYKIN